jgi:hypothetical protein
MLTKTQLPYQSNCEPVEQLRQCGHLFKNTERIQKPYRQTQLISELLIFVSHYYFLATLKCVLLYIYCKLL